MKSTSPAAITTTSVPLSPDDVRRIAEDLSSSLANDMPAGIDQGDFAAVLRGWRKFSPQYAKNQRTLHRITSKLLVAQGGKPSPFDRGEAEAWRAMHDQAADLLERLLPYLTPAKAKRAA